MIGRTTFGACIVLAGFLSAGAVAVEVPEPMFLEFETELVSLNLSGGPFPMPLGSDPENSLGDSIDGYGFVRSDVLITLSSQRAANPGPPSMGQVFAYRAGPEEVFAGGPVQAPSIASPPMIDPEELDGQRFFVDSFFDVFFDITVTDVDDRPGRDFAGQPNGATVVLPDNGPGALQSSYVVVFDKDAANYGLIPPPQFDPHIGLFNIEIPLDADINGNGENDKLTFILGTFSAGDENRQFIQLPDGTVINQFDDAAFLEGAILDESSDPPFHIGAQLPNGLPDPDAFGGPTTATSRLLNSMIPEPTTVTALTIGALAALCRRRRRQARRIHRKPSLQGERSRS